MEEMKKGITTVASYFKDCNSLIRNARTAKAGFKNGKLIRRRLEMTSYFEELLGMECTN